MFSSASSQKARLTWVVSIVAMLPKAALGPLSHYTRYLLALCYIEHILPLILTHAEDPGRGRKTYQNVTECILIGNVFNRG